MKAGSAQPGRSAEILANHLQGNLVLRTWGQPWLR